MSFLSLLTKPLHPTHSAMDVFPGGLIFMYDPKFVEDDEQSKFNPKVRI